MTPSLHTANLARALVPSSTPRLRRSSPKRVSALAAELSAILDRPIAAWEEDQTLCPCALCDAGREASFLCLACGSELPSVWPCGCLREWEQTVAMWQDVVDNYPERPDYHNRPRRTYKAWLARCLQHRPSGPCTDRQCNHTLRTCAVCGTQEGAGASDGSAFQWNDATEHVAVMFRDMRAALRTHGGAQSSQVAARSAPIVASDEVVDGDTLRGWKCALPVSGGEPLEIQLSEHWERSGQSFLQFNQAGSLSDGTFAVSPPELDVIIASLVALRDTARAHGVA